MTTTATASAVVDRRYDFVLLFDVTDGNPNGDPDAGNLPRLDPQTLQGMVTDVCLKRKIRNAVAGQAGDKPGCDLFFQTQDAAYERRILNALMERAFDEHPELDKKAFKEKKGKEKASDAAKARAWMCANFFDVRTFGAVMSTGDFNCGQVRGPVQVTFARSLDPIVPLEIAITRKSVTTAGEAENQVRTHGFITGTMGRKNTIPYGLYRAHGFVSPGLAKDTGFTWADLALLFRAIQRMFEDDRSASRGLMAVRGLHVFEHSGPLGNAPAHKLFDLLATPPLGPEAAPRSFADYLREWDKTGAGRVDRSALPSGVTCHDLTDAEIKEDAFPLA
ncbi:MAG: type I-C CRISPR-associated protein Cas7/Csd2 [Phycisphaerales bacterium]|nr:type I-C CRISPR-associated protein Cas7/Csd2 [Phycisphaerales bacterium]